MGEIAAQFPPNCHPQSYITALAQKHNLKGVFYLDLWPIADPQVILLEPALMDQVQVTRSFDQHRLGADLLEAIVGKDVVATVNGPVWKKLHNAMAPSFQMSHVRTLTGLMTGEIMTFRDTLKKLASSGEVFSMEKEASKVIFDIIAQVIFNFPLHAQTKGSRDLDDLKEVTELVTQAMSMNPLVKLKVFFKKFAVNRRVDASITAKIHERFAVLRDEKIVPSRKDFLSILDLMLRETLLNDATGQSAKAAVLPPKELALLIPK
jgi:cytochrome P450